MAQIVKEQVAYFTASRGWSCGDYISAIKRNYEKIPQRLLWYFESSSTEALSPVDMNEIAFLLNNRAGKGKLALVAESSIEYQHLLYYQAYTSGYTKDRSCELFNCTEDAEKWLIGS